MVIGRDEECARIDTLLDEARLGRGGALVVTGEAGIGKSALCAYADARASGMTVLSARGVEVECHLAFSGLLELFQGRLHRIEALPPRQAAALGSALALTAPQQVDRLTIGAAVLSLLATVAGDEPLVAIVDDVQWLDAGSAEAIGFAARRLRAERIAIIIAGRDEGAPEPTHDGLERIVLQGIDVDSGRALVRARLRCGVVQPVLDRLHEFTRGNPLALVEIAEVLDDEQLLGRAPLGDSMPPAPSLERTYVRRLAPLPQPTKLGLLAMAAGDAGRPEETAAVLSALGIDAAALVPAELAGAIDSAGGLTFRHPLIRSSVYHAASPSDRRIVHRAWANIVAGERRTWHRAAACAGQDAAVARALEDLASAAALRGAHGVAASALERSADLSPAPRSQLRRVVKAGSEAQLAGQPVLSGRLLDRALALTRQPVRRAEVQHLRGRVLLWRGDPIGARELLMGEAAGVVAAAPDRAALMLAEAMLPSAMIGSVPMSLEAAQAAQAAATGTDPRTRLVVDVCLAGALLLDGDVEHALPKLHHNAATLQEPGVVLAVAELVASAATSFAWAEEFEVAARMLDQVVALARAASTPGSLPFALASRAELGFRVGRWIESGADAAEAIELGEAVSQPAVVGFALDRLAQLQAVRGQVEACRQQVARARALADRTGAASGHAYTGATIGLLELGTGDAEAAVRALEPVAAFTGEHGLRNPTVVQWAPILVEAYTRAGRSNDAQRTLSLLEAQTQRTASRWARAVTARCRGLLAPNGDVDAVFADAIELHEQLPTPFDRARTQLCFGERLRRAGRRADARPPLRSALTTFEKLGAAPWSARAGFELRATGERVRRRMRATADRLTPQEIQVARVVASGATNREAAAALFVTPKTIEFHLDHVYRKLAIRSRTQLAVLLADAAAQREILTTSTGARAPA